MSVSSVSAASQATPIQDTAPPEPQLTPAQQGELEAGRIRVAEGQVFDGVSPDAPPTQSWGEQPAGSSYRLAFDSAAQRLGTRDPAQVGAELDRQLYAAQAAAAANDTAPSQEGVGSFFEGAVKGDLGDNDSWSALAGQTAVGFVPIVGQIADARDTAAAIGQVWRGEEGGWTALGAAAIGWVPGIGDAAKGAIRAGSNVAETGVDVARRSADEVANPGLVRTVDAATGRVQITGEGGRTGDWPRELNARTLEPNADYHINGYHYATDANGRVTSVEGRLDLETADRNGYQQRVAGRDGRLPDDQGGHLIASIFNGPGDRLNLVPMNGNFNMSAWRGMERGFEQALKDGQRVDVKIDVVYSGDGGRPAGFVVNSVVDGVERTDTFFNRPGG